MLRTVSLRWALASILLLPGLCALGSGPAGAAATTTAAAPGVMEDFLEASSAVRKEIKNVPRGGWTTVSRTYVNADIGLVQPDYPRGPVTSVREVCVTLTKDVYDAQGQYVPPDASGRQQSDQGCTEVPVGQATIATDLSSASVAVPNMQLTHYSWTCPGGDPTADCTSQASPGPAVAVRATLTATSPVDSSTTCLDQPRSRHTIDARDAAGTTSINGVDSGLNDGTSFIVHETTVRGC